MPRANTASTSSPHFTRLAPFLARHACYSCGRQLLKDAEKRHCHVCYDVFCLRCSQHTTILTEYGYPSDRAQHVCEVCNALLLNFPALLTNVEDGAGGQLLLPQQRVWVTDARQIEGASDERDAGRGQLSNAMPASGLPAAAMAAALNAASKSRKALAPENGLELFLLSFRPVNPETVLSLGEAARIPLRCIVKATRENATVRLHCTNGFVELTVGTLVVEEGRSRFTAQSTGSATPASQSTPATSPSSTQRGPGPFARFKALFSSSNGAGAEERTNSDARGSGSKRNSGDPDRASGSAEASTTADDVPPVRATSLVATDMEIDAKAAEMLEAGLEALLQNVKRHFHFRPDVAQMEALAASAAYAERDSARR